MKPSYWQYENPEKQTVHFRGKVLQYDGTKIVTVHSCEKVHTSKFKALEDAKKLIKKLKKQHDLVKT